MTDAWNPEEPVALNPQTIEKMKRKVAQNVALPGDTETWVKALREKNVIKVKKLLKEERQNLPTKYKRLYRDTDDKILNLIHFMRTHYPFFTEPEKEESTRYLRIEQMKLDGQEHPMMNVKPF